MCAMPFRRGGRPPTGRLPFSAENPEMQGRWGYCLNRGRAGKVPAHRVVNSQGYLTGAGSFEHPDMQRMLLEAEGVQVSPDMRVDMGQFGWKNTLEEALALRARFEREGI